MEKTDSPGDRPDFGRKNSEVRPVAHAEDSSAVTRILPLHRKLRRHVTTGPDDDPGPKAA